MIAIIHLERGMPCKRESLTRAEYVPALCTHRPSLLPIGWSGEMIGLKNLARSRLRIVKKFIEPYHLEEGEVVTRFP